MLSKYASLLRRRRERSACSGTKSVVLLRRASSPDVLAPKSRLIKRNIEPSPPTHAVEPIIAIAIGSRSNSEPLVRGATNPPIPNACGLGDELAHVRQAPRLHAGPDSGPRRPPCRRSTGHTSPTVGRDEANQFAGNHLSFEIAPNRQISSIASFEDFTASLAASFTTQAASLIGLPASRSAAVANPRPGT